ncbi:hypothetical protein [Alteromonas ponticola]|uniref:DUF481 domain-containing protein n=1 Tax=Alteromonas ponticola TaxID=2720613 RepID=A0ABX1R4G8_9ALTE|nr:hypothetical protein [Alteromonas ponticola]NMH59992.1 hypothetical protein [Alteromonas ponticola]
MKSISRAICRATLALAGASCFVTSSWSSELGDIVADYLNRADDFAVTFSNKKLKFNGCKQREYELTMAQHLSPRMTIEATLHYEKGRLDYGVLNQKVSARGYQLASWYQLDGYALGVSNRVVSEHEINLPLADTIELPTSQALALNMRTKGLRETHELSLSAVRETWSAKNAALGLSWDKAYDNQLRMNYSIIF